MATSLASSPPGGAIYTKASTCTDPTGFETHENSFLVYGRMRSVPKTVYDRIRSMCYTHKIKWNPSAFIIPVDYSVEPYEDIRILTALCTAVNHDVAKVIRLIRGQTSDDNRPNKHLRPSLYSKYLKDYPGLRDMCAIASDGFTSRVENLTITNHLKSVAQRSSVDSLKKLISGVH